MIGHDSDADVAWISRHTHPFDIVREARAAERTLRGLGWSVVRMSAANFKVWVPLPTGKRAGVDVFGSFHIGDHFHITGSLRGVLPREAVLPFGTVTLEGVEFPAPADVEAFLAYTYGPSWRVPDPAFHFEHPPENTRMMSQWWRGTRTRLAHWQAFYTSGDVKRVPSGPSLFASWVAGRIEPGSRVVELGSGTGRDAYWLADQGFAVTGSDYCGAARKLARAGSARRRKQGKRSVQFKGINMESPVQRAHQRRPARPRAGAQARLRPTAGRRARPARETGAVALLLHGRAVGRPHVPRVPHRGEPGTPNLLRAARPHLRRPGRDRGRDRVVRRPRDRPGRGHRPRAAGQGEPRDLPDGSELDAMSPMKETARNILDRFAGPRLAELENQVADLQVAAEESRRLNERLSDVLDVVVELLVPAVDRDDERLREALGRLGKTV